jgi:hypothetical protein
MPLAWIEDNSSRSATIVRLGRKAVSSYSKSYKVFGTTDDTIVHAEANAYLTGQLAFWQYPSQPNVKLRAESYSVSYLGDDAWQVTIAYEKAGADDDDQRDPLKRSRSFDTSGGSQHITQADTTTQDFETSYPSSAPYAGGAIGVDDTSVHGVDIVVPQLSWTETYDVPNAYVTNAYIKQIAGLTGTVNNATFRTFEAGEVLFVGASGSQEWDDEKGRGPWSLSYKFAAAKNRTGITIGTISGIQKKGWDYLWVKYESSDTGVANLASTTLMQTPRFVYVNKVYPTASFAGLGIGS